MEILMQAMNDHVKSLLKDGGILYRVNVTGEQLWDAYMQGFENDPVFRDPNSSVHNCNDCKHFIHRYANLVVLKDFEFKSIFDFPIPEVEKEEYEKSITAMLNLVKNAKIVSQFCMTTDDLIRYSYTKCPTKYHSHLGICKSVKRYTKEEAEKYGVVKPNEVRTFNHFYLELPNNIFVNSHDTSTSLTAKAVADKESLVKTMEEFSTDTITTVIDLIEQNSILNGTSYLPSLKALLRIKQEWATTPKDKREFWYWNISRSNKSIRGIRGSVMGTLLADIESGMDLIQACKSWNVKVDPINYKRAKSPITKTQIAIAQKFVEENGYIESFTRRCATMRDIEASEILHIHNNEKAPISIFDAVKTTTSNNNSKIDNAKEITIEDFMKNILPSSTSVEVFFENKHKNNLVTLITAENKESKPIFQWSNNFSWTYIGNLSGKSQITQAVQKAGGVVDAPFRFSIMWNEDGRSIVDFDAHCIYNDYAEHIYYSTKRGHLTGGHLDVDMIRPSNTGVENIYWKDLSTLKDGEYLFYIDNFDGGRNTGVKAELYTPIGTFTYEINQELKNNVKIAKVEVKNRQIVSIHHYIEPGIKSEEIYGLSTQQWHPVNLVCLSPNYWQNNVGNKHYFFFIDGCKAEDSIRGFHNEFLCSDLTPHRKVLDVLAHTMQVKSTEDQLSGLGFNATVSDELIVRVKGNKNQIFKIKF